MNPFRGASRRELLGAALVVTATACAARQTPRPYPAPTPEELLTAIRQRQQRVTSVNLETRTTSWLGGERARATVLMLVTRKGQLRFEAQVSLRGTVATLTTDGDQFALTEFEANTFKTGPACPENVAQLVRIPLLPDEIAAILLGDVPGGSDTRALGVSWDAGRGAEVLELERTAGAGAARRFTVHLVRTGGTPADYRIVAVAGDTGGTREPWRVSYDDVALSDGVSLPGVIRFAEPGRSFDEGVEIRVRDRRLNPPLTDGPFRQEPPPGFAVVPLGCGPSSR